MPMSVITVAGINPILNILGATQQLNYTQELSALQITNSFIPIIAIPSQFNMEYRNNLFSGFRWYHLTNSTDTHGSLTLQSFLNAQPSGIDIITFTESGNINIIAPMIILNNLDLNNNKIINLASPILATDATNKTYVDSHTWTTSQITDFNTAVAAFRLDQFAVPITSIDLNTQKIINLATPTLSSDAVTKAYADSLLTGVVTLISDVTGSGNVGTNITTTFRQNPIFLGNDSMTIPVGTTVQRPVTSTIGMIRYNTTITNFEIYNGTTWLPMGTGDGSVTSVTASTGLSGGVITTTGTISITNTAVTAGSYTYGSFTVNAQGQLTAANSNPVGIQASLYMSGNATATSVIANTLTKIAGTTTSAFLNNFTMPFDNQLLYSDSTTINTLVTANVSASHDVALGSTLSISIFKNGVQILAENNAYQPTINAATSLSVSVYVQFSAPTDYVEVYISSTVAAAVTVTDLNLSVTI